MNTDINDTIFDGVNESEIVKKDEHKQIRELFTSIISSKDVIKEENENIKEIKGLLKEKHGVNGKVANYVVKILMNPELLDDMNGDYEHTISIINKLK